MMFQAGVPAGLAIMPHLNWFGFMKNRKSSVRVISCKNGKMTFEVDIAEGQSFLESEEEIMDTVNAVGREMTAQSLQAHDVNAERIVLGEITAYSKGLSNEVYQSPYGPIEIPRHVFQTSQGGRIIIPLETSSKIVDKTTPKFAKQVSSKYTTMSARELVQDLEQNHGRTVSAAYLQDVVSSVGAEIESSMSDGQWEIHPSCNSDDVHAISCGLDGAMMPTRNDGWREAMTGTVTYLDCEGKRLETIYIAAAPEYGKELFAQRFLNSVIDAKKHAPEAKVIGLADGARWNWGILDDVTDEQFLDFYHATEYLAKAAEAMFPDDEKAQKEWMTKSCHKLKHFKGAAKRLLNEMQVCLDDMKYATKRKKALESVVSYFSSGYKKMQYYRNTMNNLPIGSGVTEAACKVIVKQRMCKSGSRWSIPNAEKVLIMKCMKYSGNRWNEFWSER
jgi:hypothetical protein